ncbi:MAG: S41 family peptidase [Paludibacteraceae bacterium]|nr:S41 family peptidase [Paludibacteraceae bacterium]
MKKLFLSLLILAIGILIGFLIALRSTNSLLGTIYGGMNSQQKGENKITTLLKTLDYLYVDTIDINKIDDAAVAYALSQLDPHSSYIPKEDMEFANQGLNGKFSGIGIQFNIQNDTIYIVDVISGGPSERAGILAGDRITAVDDTAFVGKGINNEKVFNKLRGKKNSTIKLEVVRRGTKEKLHFTMKRDDIPVYTVNAAHMLNDHVGYVNISSFGQKTYSEVLTALTKIKRKGANSVIIDLRGNAGGYLDAAVNILNEFLPKGALIVYIKGRAFPRSDYNANGTGAFQDMKMVVLIDEFSGSASEIFAGAIQDNDRGTIIGRRSFGKGLVQQPLTFTDGSEARITVARYYTPSGRCIQKPYTAGDQVDYDSEIWKRFVHGEFFNADSIHQNDSVTYHTIKGRTVYGGGGIMPDIFIPRDTIGFTPSFNRLTNNMIIYKFALRYTDDHRKELKTFTDWRKLESFLDSQNLVPQVVAFANENKIQVTTRDINISKSLISQYLNGYIIRNIMTEDDFYQNLNKYDRTVQRATQILK